MSTIFVLMGLLLLSYIGSLLVSGRVVRGFGLPSGSEYVILGVIVGPLVFDFIRRDTLVAFTPIVLVCIGWIALAVGIDYGWVGERRVPLRSMLLGIGSGVVTGAAVFGATYLAIPWFATVSEADRFLMAGGLGAACAETTRLATRWVIERHRAAGPVSDALGDLTHSDDLVAIVGLATLFALHPLRETSVPLPHALWFALPLLLGGGLGLMTVALLGKEFRLLESWSTLIGTSLLAIGRAARLEMPVIGVLFLVGATIAAASPHRPEIDAMVSATERSALLPALVLAGARLEPETVGPSLWLVPIAVLVRFGAKTLVGLVLRRLVPALRNTHPLIGLGLVSSGGMSIAIGFSCALRFPGVVGNTVLITAATAAVASELFGPSVLRWCLRRAGEVPDEPATTEPPREDSGTYDPSAIGLAPIVEARPSERVRLAPDPLPSITPPEPQELE